MRSEPSSYLSTMQQSATPFGASAEVPTLITRFANDPCDADLPPLSTVAIEVGRLAAADDGAGDSAAALAAIVRRDVALASQVIRVANSALHSPRTPIVSLTQAVTRLGMNEIRNIAYSFALRKDIFAAGPRDTRVGGAALAALWRESLATACFAQEIARLKRRDVEAAYLVGLMHRLGMAVMLWRLVRAPQGVDINMERLEEFAASGPEAHVGTKLATSWSLPSPIAEGIAHWRVPQDAPPAWQALLLQIAAARAFAAQLGAPEELPPELCGVPAELLDALNLYPDDVAALLARRSAVSAAVECYA